MMKKEPRTEVFIDIENLKPELVENLPVTEFESMKPQCLDALKRLYPDVYERLRTESEERQHKAITTANDSPLVELDVPVHHDFDVVECPQHYTSTSIECIDAMVETQGTKAVVDFCICNAFKYLWRHNSKNGDEDIKKANWYLNKAVELMERSQHEKSS